MKNVLLLLAGGFETYEASVFVDVMGWNLVDGDRSTRLESCGLRPEVRSSFDQVWRVDHLPGEIRVDDYEALAVPGGFAEYDFYIDAYSEPFLELIRSFHTGGKIVASVCVGALPVGRSGILKGRRGTTYNLKPERSAALAAFGADVVDAPLVFDDRIITCRNPAAAMEAAFFLLELLTSKDNADHIRRIMGFGKAPIR